MTRDETGFQVEPEGKQYMPVHGTAVTAPSAVERWLSGSVFDTDESRLRDAYPEYSPASNEYRPSPGELTSWVNEFTGGATGRAACRAQQRRDNQQRRSQQGGQQSRKWDPRRRTTLEERQAEAIRSGRGEARGEDRLEFHGRKRPVDSRRGPGGRFEGGEPYEGT